MTPVEFVAARLDEQRTECDGTGEYGGCWKLSEAMERSVEAQRKILALWDAEPFADEDYFMALETTYRTLTQQWRDHPDWQEEWA